MNLEDAERTLRQLVKELMLEQGLTDEQRHHRVALVVGNWRTLDGDSVGKLSPAVKSAVDLVTETWCGPAGRDAKYVALGMLLGTMKAEIERAKVPK